MKYYGGTEEVQKLTEWCTVDGKLSLGGMKQAAIRAGMQADLRLLDIELLARMKLPHHSFCQKRFRQNRLCRMLRNARRAIHCVGTGLRTHAILAQGAKHAMDKGHLHDSVPHSRIFGEGGLSLKWWELYDWSKKCKRKLNRWWDYWSVEIFPLFRW